MRRPLERCYASFTMLTGAVMFAYTVSNVAQACETPTPRAAILGAHLTACSLLPLYAAIPPLSMLVP